MRTLFPPEVEDSTRGHGRIEHRYIRVADAPADLPFPHAAHVVVAYRERADLADLMASSETSYYVTSLTSAKAGPEALAGHVRGRWGIENRVHWVRDVTYDEDRSQLRARSAPRALATLRNVAISVVRLAGATNVAQATRGVGRDPTRALALIGL